MTWAKFLLLFLLAGCTVTVEPLPKKPAKHYATVTHRKHHPRPSPTPTPTPASKSPLQLEPTSHPTPMIRVPYTLGAMDNFITF